MADGPVSVHLLAMVPLTGAVAAAEGFYTESMYQSERERVECILAEDVATLERRDIHAQGAIRVGELAHQIARFAAEIRADLVVGRLSSTRRAVALLAGLGGRVAAGSPGLQRADRPGAGRVARAVRYR